MRPSVLNSLFAGITRIKGIGPKAEKAFARLAGRAEGEVVPVRDLLFHLPCSVVDRRFAPPLNLAPDGAVITVTVTVESHQPPPERNRWRGRGPYKVWCVGEGGHLTLVFFNARSDWLEKMLPCGEQRVVSGKFERSPHGWQMVHPDYIVRPGEAGAIRRLEPVYPLTADVSNRQLVKWTDALLPTVPELPEWIDAEHKRRENWPDWKDAFFALHRPENNESLGVDYPARRRLAYDELLASQLALGLVRSRMKKRAGRVIKGDGRLTAEIERALPFALTKGQKEVLHTIREDLASGQRMLRLLQGDVGSGKTVVALLSAIAAVEGGGQAALMVPTELLARQHVAFIQRVAGAVGIRVCLLTGSVKGGERAAVLREVAEGRQHIVVGTHALFQEKVAFQQLDLVVIDEQHRFGVVQRVALSAKGQSPHILLMTATPIPRSLAMTVFGDMDSSELKEKPAGRQPVTTRAIPLSRAEEVIASLDRAIAAGGKVYWICPLVEQAEAGEGKTELAAAEARYREFSVRFGERVGLAHGRMKQDARTEAMQGFAGDRYDILVATTVVEVGVDVPEATVMVIEHAERFGLAQLHQLRGRVGRGDKSSSCLLLYTDGCGEVARERLRVLRETEDGFVIAEEDLRLRGFGEVLGTRQSGLPEFYFADLSRHSKLVLTARDDTKLILERDRELKTQRGTALRVLLYLFGYDESIQFLSGG